MIRLLVAGLVSTLMSVGFVTGAQAADVVVDKTCSPHKYRTHYKIVRSYRAPAITHIKTVGISPGGSRKVSKTVNFQTRVSAAVNYSSSTSVSAGKVLAKASAKVNMSLKASGSHTRSGSSTVSDRVVNRTRHNVQYVFYKGVTKANGSFRKYRCQHYYMPGQNYGYYKITYTPGRWRSYAIPGEGAVRCGAGTKNLGSLAKAALRLGCRA